MVASLIEAVELACGDARSAIFSHRFGVCGTFGSAVFQYGNENRRRIGHEGQFFDFSWRKYFMVLESFSPNPTC